MEHNGRTGSSTGEQMREGMHHVQQNLEDRLEGLREYADSADTWIRSFARDRPFLAIGCAIGLGFLVGRLASRT